MTHTEDDPHDTAIHWLDFLYKEGLDRPKRIAERATRGRQQPDIQCKKPPVAERQQAKHLQGY
jgi:hypothetical protein